MSSAPAPSLDPFYIPIVFETIDSTSDELRRLAARGANEGTLIVARTQTSGHGRFGRTWISPPGNLYFSVLLRPERPAAEATQVTFLAALAAADAVEASLPRDRAVTCKWPNDVLVSARKVAGILLESTAESTGTISALVVGVGINVDSHPPSELLMYPATSIAAEGGDRVTAACVLHRFCEAFLRYYRTWQQQGFANLRRAWLERAHGLGEKLIVRQDETTLQGAFRGIDAGGALLLQDATGVRTVLAGDVVPGDAPMPVR